MVTYSLKMVKGTSKLQKTPPVSARDGGNGSFSASPNGRKAKGDVKMISVDQPKRSCVCKIVGLQGNLAALFVEKSPGEKCISSAD